ncbi:MAG: sortase, partial [Ruminococcaceae bacterium]|nr:sortase [Oscillospiraceae bacterium]
MLKKLFADKRANARRAVIAVLAVGFLIFVYFINQVQKPELVTTVGRTFERAKVVEVVKDNLQEDGRRYGEQTVRLLMLSGRQKGETVEATSSAGYLFGAGCTPGMEVITIQSVSGDISVTSVYSANREPVVYAFVLLFFLIQKSKLGLAIRSTASNEKTAKLMGVPTALVTLFAWAVAVVLGSLSGAMVAPATSVSINLMDSVQVCAFIAC